ncbi:MAG TPA: type VI secretion system-associated protein TagF [Planctomycetota bacterium]|jgi:type VI secretion system protein ImpM|nr:type VI secretion system-associated protein TagF [Planctomycetota bacterium]
MRLLPGCYGKLPIHGDFIRHKVPGPELDLLDEWLQSGIVVSRQALGEAWDASFDASPPRSFLFQPKTGQGLAGVVMASRDKPGRRYPFMVFTPVDLRSLGREEHLLPLALAPFLRLAEEAAVSGWKGADLKAFLAKVDQLPTSADLDAGRKGAQEFASRGAKELWERLFGSAQDSRKYLLYRNLVETLQTSSVPRYVLRFPRVGGEAEVAFWLDLARRVGRRSGLPTLTFWRNSPGEAGGGMPVVYDSLKANYFLPLWWPERPGNQLFALDDPGGTPDLALQAARDKYAPILDDPAMSLGAFLGRLGS